MQFPFADTASVVKEHCKCGAGIRVNPSHWTHYQPNNPTSPVGTPDALKTSQED